MDLLVAFFASSILRYAALFKPSLPLCSAFGSHLIRPDLHRLPPAEHFSATLTLAASLVRA